MRGPKIRTSTVAAVVALALGLAACGGDDDNATGRDPANGGKVALLLPDNRTTRYESHDRPIFESKLRELCSSCELIYANAERDVSRQQRQVDAAVADGASVIVLDPVDATSAGAMVAGAGAQDVAVISYDRLIMNADVDQYISFDSQAIGRLQATALLDKLRADAADRAGPVVMINGPPTDNNALLLKDGAHDVLDNQVTIGREYDTPDWSADHAQREMSQAITTLGANIAGVYAANDATASGAIAAMKAARFDPIPPVTGQDAELGAIQRILAGDQFMTVYKAVKLQAERAAAVAAALAQGEDPPTTDERTNNGRKDVPSHIFPPVAVTKDNIDETVIRDGYWTRDQICTAQFASACAAAGI